MQQTVEQRTAPKKYELTDETTKSWDGRTLRRIRALVTIASIGVSAGDLGGFIELEGNLDQSGDTWVSGDAEVSGNAWVYGDARVYGNAWVSGNARVYGDARVSGDARVTFTIIVPCLHYLTHIAVDQFADSLTFQRSRVLKLPEFQFGGRRVQPAPGQFGRAEGLMDPLSACDTLAGPILALAAIFNSGGERTACRRINFSRSDSIFHGEPHLGPA
ncbi:hypothetical protein [Acetobacter persici]|uniref:hypothetical protein n=1 Tax=Acetobacter persici TaxID=1076596 RepID=UPI0038D2299D